MKTKEALEDLKQLGYVSFVDKPTFRPIIFHGKCLQWSLDTVYLEVTDLCNLSCSYCYAKPDSKVKRKLNTEDIFGVIDELASIGVLKIIFTGGEALLHKDIFKILGYTKSKKIDFSLFTNGTLLNRNTVKKLKALNPESIAISVDSNRAEIHDMNRGAACFSRTLKGIRLLHREKIPIRINSTILKGVNDKTEDIEGAIRFFMRKGASRIVMGPIMAYGKGVESEDLILPLNKSAEIAAIFKKHMKELKSKHYEKRTPPLKLSASFRPNNGDPHSVCGVGTSACYIRSDGDVILCPVLREKKYCAGNILNKGLRKIWLNSGVFNHFRTNTVNNIAECRECAIKLKCVGGCKARALIYNGRFDSPDLWRCSAKEGFWASHNSPENQTTP